VNKLPLYTSKPLARPCSWLSRPGMGPPHLANVHPIVEFTNYVRGNRSTGYDILWTQRPYVSRHAQRQHWNRANILAALKAQSPNPHVPIDTIQNKYYGVFSTLVYNQKITHLEDFFTTFNLDDGQFPLSNLPPQWLESVPPSAPIEPVYLSLFESIRDHQFLFFALVFNPDHLVNRRLSADHVLPIVHKETLQLGDATDSEVYKIVVDRSYNELVPKVSPSLQGQTLWLPLTTLCRVPMATQYKTHSPSKCKRTAGSTKMKSELSRILRTARRITSSSTTAPSSKATNTACSWSMQTVAAFSISSPAKPLLKHLKRDFCFGKAFLVSSRGFTAFIKFTDQSMVVIFAGRFACDDRVPGR
jgi:hypothetical protein